MASSTKVSPYLSFDGRCREALAFYAEVLGGQTGMTMRWGDSPMAGSVAPDWHDKILHARLNVGERVIMASDAPPGRYQPPQGVHLSLEFTDPAEADRVFARLADRGHVTMPIESTFWALRFGMLVDRFGIPWMVNCERPA